jgi:hypothetical protein
MSIRESQTNRKFRKRSEHMRITCVTNKKLN